MAENTHDPAQGDEIELPDGGIVTVDIMNLPEDPMTGILISVYLNEETAYKVESAVIPSLQQWEHVLADVLKVIRNALVARSQK